MRLSFDIKIHSDVSSTWSSLVAFKGNGGGGNNQEYGDRIPVIYFNKDTGELGVRSAVSGNKNYPFNYAIDIGTWYTIEIAQIETEEKVRLGVSSTHFKLMTWKVYFTVNINGAEVLRTENTDPRRFEAVKVFAGDDFYSAADATYRNLNWTDGGGKFKLKFC